MKKHADEVEEKDVEVNEDLKRAEENKRKVIEKLDEAGDDEEKAAKLGLPHGPPRGKYDAHETAVMDAKAKDQRRVLRNQNLPEGEEPNNVEIRSAPAEDAPGGKNAESEREGKRREATAEGSEEGHKTHKKGGKND